jgi:thymidylate synthase (FAD)
MKATYQSHYLSDTDVANFARQSFANLAANFTEKQNNNLIRFLARGMASGDWEGLIDQMVNTNDQGEARKLAVYLRSIPEHWVPFGHPHISIRMQAPIPIARQAFKHKIGFVESEESRRYISSIPEIYIPTHFRQAAESVKQGSAGKHRDSHYWLVQYKVHCQKSLSLYNEMIKEGVCPEQARLILPQGTEVNWLWTGSLYAFANFFNQRTDSHAQKEIQDLAHEIGQIIAPLYPVSWPALTQGQY